MKKIISIIAIIAIILLTAFLWPTSPSQTLPQANFSDSISEFENEKSEETKITATTSPQISLEIIGFGPGKSHPGTFTDYKITDFSIDGNGNPVTGKITIQSSSREYEIDGLNKHLCAEEFLDCENYPEIIFELTDFVKQSEDSQNYLAIGNLFFKGKTSTVGFPVNKDGENWSADFRLNVKNIGVTYIGIDDEIQIKIKTL